MLIRYTIHCIDYLLSDIWQSSTIENYKRYRKKNLLDIRSICIKPFTSSWHSAPFGENNERTQSHGIVIGNHTLKDTAETTLACFNIRSLRTWPRGRWHHQVDLTGLNGISPRHSHCESLHNCWRTLIRPTAPCRVASRRKTRFATFEVW